ILRTRSLLLPFVLTPRFPLPPFREGPLVAVSELRRRDPRSHLPRREEPRVGEAEGSGDALGEERVDRQSRNAPEDLAKQDVAGIRVDDLRAARVLGRQCRSRPDDLLRPPRLRPERPPCGQPRAMSRKIEKRRLSVMSAGELAEDPGGGRL